MIFSFFLELWVSEFDFHLYQCVMYFHRFSRHWLVSFHFSLKNFQHFLQSMSSSGELPQQLTVQGNIYFFLLSERYHCQIKFSWLVISIFQHFGYIIPLTPDLRVSADTPVSSFLQELQKQNWEEDTGVRVIGIITAHPHEGAVALIFLEDFQEGKFKPLIKGYAYRWIRKFSVSS